MHRRLRLALLALLVLVFAAIEFQRLRGGDLRPVGDDRAGESPAAIADADRRLSREIDGLAPQRPGHPDLYVLGIAGDGTEQVFLNEVRHLRDLAERRLDAAGRVLVLANHPPQVPFRAPVPATEATLRTALAGLGAAMDPAEDILLLYITTHGSDEHWLLLRRGELDDRRLDAGTLRDALDDAGIRHRVLALSACYSGGLAPALQTPDTLILTAARRDRTSFGCGNDSVATFFGRAWLVDGLNGTVDFTEAFRQARTAIRTREAAEDFEPSRPQIRQGGRIGRRLAAWQAAFRPGPPVPYPHEEPAPADGLSGEAAPEDADEIVPPWLPPAQRRQREAAAVEARADRAAAVSADDPVSAAARPAGGRPSRP